MWEGSYLVAISNSLEESKTIRAKWKKGLSLQVPSTDKMLWVHLNGPRYLFGCGRHKFSFSQSKDYTLKCKFFQNYVKPKEQLWIEGFRQVLGILGLKSTFAIPNWEHPENALNLLDAFTVLSNFSTVEISNYVCLVWVFSIFPTSQFEKNTNFLCK